MKTFTIILHFCLFGVITLSASNNPTPASNPASEITYTVKMNLGLGARTFYTERENYLEFSTDQYIDVVQIFNKEGKLEFQLSVQSDYIRIGKSLFDKGEYTLGFLLSNQNSLKFAKVKVL